MLNAKLYNLTQQTQGQIFATMQKIYSDQGQTLEPLPPLLQTRRGYAESPGWFMIQAAEFDPEPLTVENLRVRDIYASERIVQAILEMLAGEKWLERTGEAYKLTTAGRELIQQLQGRSTAVLESDTSSLPADLIHEIETKLGHIINLCLQHNNQPEAWCLNHSRNRAPKDSASRLQKISQYCSDFNAFRDDAHMAAWQAEQVDGYIWEAFSLVATGQATTAEDVYTTLFYRGYSRDEYVNGLEELVTRNWLINRSNQYKITTIGEQIRAKVEAKTDAYFYAPWSSFSIDEASEIERMLQKFCRVFEDIRSTG